MNTKKLLFYLLAALLGGCVPVMSLHPLYTEKDMVFEKKLLGTWVDDSNEATWQFKHPNEPEKAYELIFSDDEGQKGSFVAHLVKLQNRLFLDIYPNQFPCGDIEDPNKIQWFYNAFFLVSVHTFIKVDSIEPQLKMRLTDATDTGKLLKEDPNTVKHELVDGSFTLTASTKELQAFVLKYADDSRVFADEIILNRKKAKDPNGPDAVDFAKMEPNSTDPNEG